jgi:hypothetical protein
MAVKTYVPKISKDSTRKEDFSLEREMLYIALKNNPYK